MPSLYQVCLDSIPNMYNYCFFTCTTDRETFFITEGSENVYFDTTSCGEVTIFGENYFAEFSIYPNPTNSLLTIETDNPDCYSIDIHSLNGQLIYKEEIEGNSKQIDITPFSKGIYFITLRSDAWVRTEKVIKY